MRNGQTFNVLVWHYEATFLVTAKNALCPLAYGERNLKIEETNLHIWGVMDNFVAI